MGDKIGRFFVWVLHKVLHTHRTFDEKQLVLNEKAP